MELLRIVNNYDLMEEVITAREDYGIRRMFIDENRFVTLGYTLHFLLTGVAFKGSVSISDLLLDSALLNLLMVSSISLIKYFKITQVGDLNQLEAKNNLGKLTCELIADGVATSVELLKESYKTGAKYRIKLNKHLIPNLFQEKYVIVPTYNDGKIGETSIKQEHEMFTGSYILSRGSSVKQKVFRPVFSNN